MRVVIAAVITVGTVVWTITTAPTEQSAQMHRTATFGIVPSVDRSTVPHIKPRGVSAKTAVHTYVAGATAGATIVENLSVLYAEVCATRAVGFCATHVQLIMQRTMIPRIVLPTRVSAGLAAPVALITATSTNSSQ